MHQSLQSMAQLTLSVDAPLDDAMEMIHGLNREWRHERVVLTLTALVVKAAALALHEHSQLNVRLIGELIVANSQVNIGVAVDHPEGVFVPVLRGADGAPLMSVARELAVLIEKVREGAVSVEDMTGGSFTVTSLEGFAVDTFTPIINPPQAAILGVGRIRDVAVFTGDAVRRGQATTLNLTFDHRLLDGAAAARFLGRVVELLGRPYMLM
jgi:pyruvate dehydrogenase E2 component (dihydrolipoamide acetyltransferase)